jgi:tetratricopeptide (TPR) repeat protein
MFVLAGCERHEQTPFAAEVDEPSFRRGKDLLRQGRNQEALTEFQRVIEKRGLNNAPESHLELGLLYQYHIRDPIAAIYHYRRFRELKPTSQQAELVRQRIDAATREFARTLPGDPLENLKQFETTDVVQRLHRENEQLKAELARARLAKQREVAEYSDPENVVETNGPAYPVDGGSPIAASEPSEVETAPALPPPTRPMQVTPVPTLPPNRPTPTPAVAGRRHVVVKGDTLMGLAHRYYGNRSRWRDIVDANRDTLRGPEDLKIGMELKIP